MLASWRGEGGLGLWALCKVSSTEGRGRYKVGRREGRGGRKRGRSYGQCIMEGAASREREKV